MLVDIGGQLARDPAIRAEINRGMVRVLADFVQSQKSGVGRFIADQVKAWDIDMLIGRIELTVGRDLQYIRFNGALIGGLAGLALHALEQGLKLGSYNRLEVRMADAPQNFTDMFKNLGEQLKIPSFDMTKIMEHQQKNLEAMTKSWQAMAGGASEIANKQRAIFEAAVKDVTAMVQEYKPGGSPQDIMAKQAEFAKKAMEAAIANTRDIAELVQKSSTEAFKIVQDRMKESYEEIRTSVEKKM